MGPFKLDQHDPYVVRAARDITGELRRVIVFRLRQAGPIHFDQHDVVPPASKTRAELVPASVTSSKLIAPERGKNSVTARAEVPATQAERREAALSEMLEEQLKIAKHHVARYQIHITGKTARLLTDLYDVTAHTLYELKSDSSRESR